MSSDTQSELFDLGRQERLAQQIGRDRFNAMLTRFAERIETSLSDAGHLALSPSGLPDLRAEAHAVAGLAANFGAVSLAAHARDLERAAEAGDHAAVGAVLDQYRCVAKNTLSALRDA
jgi:HPt (histidine-containing phosphotransfer) domain-containing protein